MIGISVSQSEQRFVGLNSLGSVGTLVLISRRKDRTLIPGFGNNVSYSPVSAVTISAAQNAVAAQ